MQISLARIAQLVTASGRSYADSMYSSNDPSEELMTMPSQLQMISKVSGFCDIADYSNFIRLLMIL